MKLHRSRVRRQLALVAFAIVASLLIVAVGAVAALAAEPVYVPNEYIVTTAPGASYTAIQRAVAQVGGVVVKQLPLANTYLVRMGGNNGSYRKSSTVSRVAAQSWVLTRFSPNYVYRASAGTVIPNDPRFDFQWGMGLINAPKAWSVQKGSASVTVAVNDTGVSNHPDFTGPNGSRLVPGYDFVENDADPSNDIDGHGTHVAGIIAAQGDNSLGVTGVCWEGVNIMPIRVLDDFGYGTTASVLQGLDFALQQHVNVVNMSYGGGPDDDVEHQKIKELDNAGIILCASAGNSGSSVEYPAAWPEVIAVASIGPNDEIAYYSSYGPGNEVDIAAPGGDPPFGIQAEILSTGVTWENGVPSYDYVYMSGTSMASPHVAGAAALLLSNGIPASEVRDRLTMSARKPRTGTMDTRKYGAGILDVSAALTSGSILISKPVKGSTVTDNPDFKISVRGTDPNSLYVYMDYADGDENDLPDDLSAETPVLAERGAIKYLNASGTGYLFNWSDLSNTPLTPGLHFIYVTATTTAGETISDWGTFSVTSNVIQRGTYMIALPYASALDLNDGLRHPLPQELLWDASTSLPLDFRTNSQNRSKLIRWSPLDGQYLYYLPDADNNPSPNERSWMNLISPFYNAPTGGGFTVEDPNTLQYPAGTGFWLILQQDAVLSNVAPAISAPAGFQVPLYRGWNLIGNPYTHPVALSTIKLKYHGQTRTLQQDQDPKLTVNPWVQRPAGQSSQFFGYSNDGIPGYVAVPWIGGMLQPYQGYWLRALVGGSLPQDRLLIILQ